MFTKNESINDVGPNLTCLNSVFSKLTEINLVGGKKSVPEKSEFIILEFLNVTLCNWTPRNLLFVMSVSSKIIFLNTEPEKFFPLMDKFLNISPEIINPVKSSCEKSKESC